MQDRNKNSKTVVECYLTGCKYNTACCLSPHVFSNIKCYCTKEHIAIDINEDDDYTFSCIDFESGHKKKQCIDCIMKDNDGIIPLGDDDIFDIIEVDGDDEFLS